MAELVDHDAEDEPGGEGPAVLLGVEEYADGGGDEGDEDGFGQRGGLRGLRGG